MGTVDRYPSGSIGFLTNISVTGDIDDARLSYVRAWSLAMLHSFDDVKILKAFEALGAIELEQDDDFVMGDQLRAKNAYHAKIVTSDLDRFSIKLDDE